MNWVSGVHIMHGCVKSDLQKPSDVVEPQDVGYTVAEPCKMSSPKNITFQYIPIQELGGTSWASENVYVYSAGVRYGGGCRGLHM